MGPTREDVRPGLEIPTFEREAGFHAWNRFAAVNEEFVPIHMDDEAGRAAGNEGAFGMGSLLLSYVHCVLHQWIGDAGRIASVSLQYRAPSLRGSTTIAGGQVREVREEAGETLVDLDVWTRSDTGVVLTTGSATVALG